MFSMPLQSIDGTLVPVPQEYILSAEFFQLDQPITDERTVPFTQEILQLAFSGELPTIDTVDQVLEVHNFFKSKQAKKMVIALTRFWISRGLRSKDEANHIRSWIGCEQVASIVRAYNYQDVFPTSYNAFENRFFWWRVNRLIHVHLPMEDFINKLSANSTNPRTRVKFLLRNWHKDRLHTLMESCSNAILYASYLGLKINECNGVVPISIIERYTSLRQSNLIDFWYSLGLGIHPLIAVHTLIDLRVSDLADICEGIVRSGNSDMFKSFVDYLGVSTRSMAPTLRIMCRLRRYASLSMIEEYNNYAVEVPGRKSPRVIKLDRALVNTTKNTETFMELRTQWEGNLSINLIDRHILIHLIDNTEPTEEMWLNVTRIGDAICDLINRKRYDTLRTIPYSRLKNKPDIVYKLEQLGITLM